MWRLDLDGLDALIAALKKRGYRVAGPKVQNGTIVLEELDSTSDLPAGWRDEQEAGTYRISKNGSRGLFEFACGPVSWKKFLHQPRVRLWRAKRDKRGLHLIQEDVEPPKLGILGARACEISAIEIQDKVFLAGEHKDSFYEACRKDLFIVAVNCSHPASTCFCVSMNTGPRATRGFDLALTEVVEEGAHYFVLEAGSDRGEEVLAEIPRKAAEQEEVAAAIRVTDRAAAAMKRSLDTDGIKDLLYRNFEHPRWDHVAKRCLSCANCTMVCPTCFCTTVEDATDLSGENAERWRRWDSCFTKDFTYIHGGSIRPSTCSRYRQWVTHKLASWIDQFGTSGCVGCGRCITWCPVGIDITEEARAIRESAGGAQAPRG
jgi:ferredoxin